MVKKAVFISSILYSLIFSNEILISGDQEINMSYIGALRDVAMMVRTETTGETVFHAGTLWDWVWTRDGAYSIQMATGILYPEVSKTTLEYTADASQAGLYGGLIPEQDVSGSFQGWPHLTDAIVWAPGFWDYYLMTNDEDFLEYGLETITRGLKRAEDEVKLPSGLFGGCASFLESRSAYPTKYIEDTDLLTTSAAMSTNALYYQGYVVAHNIEEELGIDHAAQNFMGKAEALKTAINTHLWNPEKGYYDYYKDPESLGGELSGRQEGLGEAFAIMYGIADSAKTESIFENVHITEWGFPCNWPQTTEWSDYSIHFGRYYHNGMIWPFVQGFWGWAAAMERKPDALWNEIRVMNEFFHRRYISAAPRSDLEEEKTPQFWEFYFPNDAQSPGGNSGGFPGGSPHQLWSASGFIATIHNGVVGINWEREGIRLNPLVPKHFTAPIALNGIKYGDKKAGTQMVLNITVVPPAEGGDGMYVKSFTLNGVPGDPANAFIPRNLTGTVNVQVEMSSTPVTSIRDFSIASGSDLKLIQVPGQNLTFTSDNHKDYKLGIYDINGNQITEVKAVGNKAEINSHFIPSGTFIAVLNLGDAIYRQVFIRQ